MDCVSPTDTFQTGQRVYITLESRAPIVETIIIGHVYRAMPYGKYDDHLGTKNFEIGPNTFKLKHYIPFDELAGTGPHLIEFTKEDGSVLITKELFIK